MKTQKTLKGLVKIDRAKNADRDNENVIVFWESVFLDYSIALLTLPITKCETVGQIEAPQRSEIWNLDQKST